MLDAIASSRTPSPVKRRSARQDAAWQLKKFERPFLYMVCIHNNMVIHIYIYGHVLMSIMSHRIIECMYRCISGSLKHKLPKSSVQKWGADRASGPT